jgi:hypothetical protein
MKPPRSQRRDLSRRADRLLERLSGMVVNVPPDASPKTSVLLLSERTTPVVIQRKKLMPALLSAGLDCPSLFEILSEIEVSQSDDGKRYPAIILIEGWMQVAFVESFALSPGGAA